MKHLRICNIARNKLRYYKSLNQFGGFLTQSEIGSLVADGYVPAPDCAIPPLDSPDVQSRWFYFIVERGTYAE